MDTTDLGDFLQSEVYPALFDRLDSAFPEYALPPQGQALGGNRRCHTLLPGSPRPDRVHCYSNVRGGSSSMAETMSASSIS